MRNPCAKRAVPPSRWAAPFARDAAVLSLEARKADERRRLAARLPAALAACDREIVDLRHRFGFKWSTQSTPAGEQQ